jgi:hypothetical protein
MTDPSDLAFFADALIGASRYPDAIACVERLISSKPTLDFDECRLFELAFKRAIDPIRSSLRALLQFYEASIDTNELRKAGLIGRYRDTAHSELNLLCRRAIAILTNLLLPHAESVKATVFFYKLLGDYWRYIAEYAIGAEYNPALQEAQGGYERGWLAPIAFSKVTP